MDAGLQSDSDSNAISKAFENMKRKRSVEKQSAGASQVVESAQVVDDTQVVEAAEGVEPDEDNEKPDGSRSWIWGHFEKIKKPVYGMKNGKRVQIGEEQKAKCNWCAKLFAFSTKSTGTSSLLRHIKDVCKKYSGRVKMDDGQQKLSSTSTKQLTMVKWSQQGCREAAVKMMVMDELPFSFIEKEGFRYFCRYHFIFLYTLMNIDV